MKKAMLVFLFVILGMYVCLADDVDIKTSTVSGTNGVSITNSDASIIILKASSNGQVGINTSTINHTLEVNGNIGQTAGSYINYGSTNGSTGYGIRDNSGVMEFKNSGGSWTAFTGTGSGSNAYSYGQLGAWHTADFVLGAQNTYTTITFGSLVNYSTLSAGYVSITSSGSGTYDQFTINSGGSGVYRIEASVTVETPLSGNQTQNLEVEVFKCPSGGSFSDVETLSGGFRIANSGDKDDGVVTGFLSLDEGDSVDLRIRSDATSGRSVKFICANFNIQKVK